MGPLLLGSCQPHSLCLLLFSTCFYHEDAQKTGQKQDARGGGVGSGPGTKVRDQE